LLEGEFATILFKRKIQRCSRAEDLHQLRAGLNLKDLDVVLLLAFFQHQGPWGRRGTGFWDWSDFEENAFVAKDSADACQRDGGNCRSRGRGFPGWRNWLEVKNITQCDAAVWIGWMRLGSDSVSTEDGSDD
jgi:hypothetical protein